MNEQTVEKLRRETDDGEMQLPLIGTNEVSMEEGYLDERQSKIIELIDLLYRVFIIS